MKHLTIRILSLALAVLLCVGFVSAGTPTAAAAEGTTGSGITWSLENGVLTFTGSGAMTNYNEYNMAPWLEYADSIQRVVVGQGITDLGDLAFYHCTKLKTVILPDSARFLGSLAFAGCSSLAQITMNGVTQIKWGCFYDCTSLVNVILPQGLQVIEKEAFYRCKSLGGITIPASVVELGSSVFAYCDSLSWVRIEAPILDLPYWTFYGCDNLKQLYLPETVQSVGSDALSECPSLHYVDFGGSQETKEEIQDQLSQPTTRPQSPSIDKDVSYTQTPGAAITTTDKTQVGDSTPSDTDKPGLNINATVTDSTGWGDVTQSVTDTMNGGKNPTVDVQVQGNVVMPEGTLAGLSDKEVTVNIHTSENVDWKVILGDQTSDTLKGSQDFSVDIEKNNSDKYADTIGSSESYIVTLGDTTLNATILFPLGSDTARQVATLYVVDGNSLRKLSSVIVDDDGKAAFCLAGTEAGEYVLALDVPNISKQEVLVPEVLAPQYDITYGATLTDSQGNQYVLTGRVNKLGFGLGTLTLIVLGVLVGSGVVVGVIMTIWNKQKMKAMRTAEQRHRRK